ncbi:MAG: hypothetical protein IJH53_05050 [Oscillospiraceae bacterium]|nr:hypothetical protein [Oscillospiraceae bacterium]
MKRILPILLSAILLLSACSSQKTAPEKTPVLQQNSQTQAVPKPEQSTEEAPAPAEPGAVQETDWLAVYAPVFDSYEILFTVVDAYKQGGEASVDLTNQDYDLASNLSLYLESMAKPGYCLIDLDANGVPELIVGLMTDDAFFSRIIASLFTVENGAPKLVFTSYTRSRYCLSSDGGFIYAGSGGAAYSDYYACSFSGSELTRAYGVYSDGDRGFFYCENGDRESAAKTESITQEQFSEWFNKLDGLIIDPPAYTMMDFVP